MLYKEKTEQNESPPPSPETKSREEQRWEYYEKNRDRINNNNLLINNFNGNRSQVFSKCSYKHNFNQQYNRGYLSYEQGIKEMERYVPLASANERNHMGRMQQGEVKAFQELNNMIKKVDTKSEWKFSFPGGQEFNIKNDDAKYGFAPKIKFIMLTHTSSTPPDRTFLFQFTNINIPSNPQKEEVKKPEVKKEVKQKIKPNQNPPAKIQEEKPKQPEATQQTIANTELIRKNPNMCYSYSTVHNDGDGTTLSNQTKYGIINNNGDLKEFSFDALSTDQSEKERGDLYKNLFIDYKLSAAEWKNSNKSQTIFNYFLSKQAMRDKYGHLFK